MKIIFSLTQILVILLCGSISAQRRSNNGIGSITQWEVGLSSGVSSFVTSVNPERGAMSKKINYWSRGINPGIGLSLKRNFTPSLGIEISWLNTRLTGTWNDRWSSLLFSEGREIPLTFNSQINQFDLMMAFNLNQMMLPGDEEDSWHIFFKTGLGITNIKDTKKFYPDGSNYAKKSIVLDGGLSVSVNEKIKLMIGSTFRIVNTDNLDGVHVISTDLSGKTVSYMRVYEIYNYSYLRVNYGFGDFGSKKHKSTFKNRR